MVAAELVPDSDVAASARTPPVPFSGSWASAQCRWPPALIHYRPTLPIRITVRTPDPKDGAGGGPLVAERIFNVLLPSTEPLAIQFEAVAFSTQGITVGFDDAGRLIEVKRSGTSPVAGATSGLAGGAKEAQEAYTSALDVRRKLIEQQRDLLKVQVEMEELKRQLAELEGQ